MTRYIARWKREKTLFKVEVEEKIYIYVYTCVCVLINIKDLWKQM